MTFTFAFDLFTFALLFMFPLRLRTVYTSWQITAAPSARRGSRRRVPTCSIFPRRQLVVKADECRVGPAKADNAGFVTELDLGTRLRLSMLGLCVPRASVNEIRTQRRKCFLRSNLSGILRPPEWTHPIFITNEILIPAGLDVRHRP